MAGIRQCGMYRVKRPYHYNPPSTILRRGVRLKNGLMLWEDYGTGKLYVEDPKVAQ